MAAVALVLAIGWRSRRWRLVWLPVAVVVGLSLAAWTHWCVDSQGMAGDPAPTRCGSGPASPASPSASLSSAGGAPWWRRVAAVVAVPLCLLGAGLALNKWVGYFPTVQVAWNQLTAGRCPTRPT